MSWKRTGHHAFSGLYRGSRSCLQTVTTSVEIDLEGESSLQKKIFFALDSYGIEKAYEEFQKENELDMKFYCVGYTVMRYYMNHYPMSNLENHKAKIIAADLIATLPAG